VKAPLLAVPLPPALPFCVTDAVAWVTPKADAATSRMVRSRAASWWRRLFINSPNFPVEYQRNWWALKRANDPEYRERKNALVRERYACSEIARIERLAGTSLDIETRTNAAAERAVARLDGAGRDIETRTNAAAEFAAARLGGATEEVERRTSAATEAAAVLQDRPSPRIRRTRRGGRLCGRPFNSEVQHADF
jgi:hypothetical protein